MCSSSFQWFGLNSSGRSFGSSQDTAPLWIQILGQHLRPTEFLDEDEKVAATSDSVLIDQLNFFYRSLTTGDFEGLSSVFSAKVSPAVTEVVSAGGRIDSWADCLVEGARPEGMKISGTDSAIVSDNKAFTTTIEFPANVGLDSATLLAVQEWERISKEDPWKLVMHQTIPWSPESKAQGTLRCDCRGCVALTRSPERRTFGGLIG